MNWSLNLDKLERKPVTLPRVLSIDAGRGYTTVEYVHEDDGRGDHMRARVKRRDVRRAGR